MRETEDRSRNHGYRKRYPALNEARAKATQPTRVSKTIPSLNKKQQTRPQTEDTTHLGIENDTQHNRQTRQGFLDAIWVSKTIPSLQWGASVQDTHKGLFSLGYRKRYPALKETRAKEAQQTWVSKTIPSIKLREHKNEARVKQKGHKAKG